jgi:hypothetical protein
LSALAALASVHALHLKERACAGLAILADPIVRLIRRRERSGFPRTAPYRKESRQVKIAQVAPLYESVPPRLYGGTERIVAHLTDALVELGHDVTLFASADARTSAKLVSVRNQAIRLDPHPLKSDLAAHLSMLQELHLREDEFDVIHFHVDLIHFPFFEELAHKTVTTLHGRLDLKDLSEAYARWPQYPLVSISNDQRRPLPVVSQFEIRRP